jgi:hypothetical protein
MKRSLIIVFICFALAYLWSYAALSKLVIYEAFTLQLGKLPFIGTYNYLLRWMLPTVEILAALLLIFQRTFLTGLYASITMLVSFTAYLTAMKLLKIELPCSCGGIISRLTWAQHIWFNLLCIAIAIVGVLLTHTKSIKEETTVTDIDYKQQLYMQ